jgi:hypothetical protein
LIRVRTVVRIRSPNLHRCVLALTEQKGNK